MLKNCEHCSVPFHGYTQRRLCVDCQTKRHRLENHLRRLRRYRLTPKQHARLLSDQSGKCANPKCNARTRLHVDHSHRTGKVRGILCMGCNIALGFLLEDPQRMLGLAEYIRQHPEPTSDAEPLIASY